MILKYCYSMQAVSFLELITDDQLSWGSVSLLVHWKVCTYWGGCVQSWYFVMNTYRNFVLNAGPRSVAYVCTVMWLNFTKPNEIWNVFEGQHINTGLQWSNFQNWNVWNALKIPVFWNIMLCILVCRYPCLEKHIAGIFTTAQVTLLGLPWKCWQYAPPTAVPNIPFYVVSYHKR